MRLNPLYLLIVFFIHSCNFIDKNPSSLNSFIPKDASIIIRIHNPNKFKSDVLKRNVKLKVSNAALRSVDYNGGLDFYLKNVKSFKLSKRAKKLKNKIIAKN